MPGHDGEVYIGGNEGYGIVEEVTGTQNTELKPGDWVVFGRPQMGTWSSHMVCNAQDVVKIEQNRSLDPLTDVMASTLQVNPATAYRMLNDFVSLKRGKDVVMQNAANSAVGQAVAQIASRKLGIETINLVRSRPNLADLKQTFAHFSDRGTKAKAHLFTYDELANKSSDVKYQIRDIIEKSGRLRLGLNALCGPDNMNMVKYFDSDATLVTYGAMSKQPLSLPAGLIIFKNLAVRGFMMNQWYQKHDRTSRQHLMRELVEWYQDKTLEPPRATIVEVSRSKDVTETARKAIGQSMEGYGGQKIFLRFTE